MDNEHDQRKPILVTGAGAGLGAATALEAAKAHHPLILIDRDEAALETIRSRALSAGAPAVAAQIADVSHESELVAAIQETVAVVGMPRGTACFAGIELGGPSHDIDIDVWDRVMAVNLRGTFLTCRTVIRMLLEQGEPGAIVCVASILASVSAGRGTTPYCASKAGVLGLVRSLAVEYADRGIRVNAISPGPTESELLWASVPPSDRERVRGLMEAQVPLGRIATPGEQARTTLWLLSDQASYITGADLNVDGGVLAQSSFTY